MHFAPTSPNCGPPPAKLEWDPPREVLIVPREKTNLSCQTHIVKEPRQDFAKIFSRYLDKPGNLGDFGVRFGFCGR
jgi:hypothetical protein